MKGSETKAKGEIYIYEKENNQYASIDLYTFDGDTCGSKCSNKFTGGNLLEAGSIRKLYLIILCDDDSCSLVFEWK